MRKVQVGEILSIRPEDVEEDVVVKVKVLSMINDFMFNVVELEGDCAGIEYSANLSNIVE